MEYRHEIIQFSSDLPFKIFIHKIGEVSMHWHHSIELLYVVSGQLDILLGHEEMHLQKGGLILVNPNIPHSLSSRDALLIAVQVKAEHLNYICASGKPTVFDCICEKEEDDDGRFRTLKEILAQIIQNNLETQHHIDCLNASHCYRLMYELYSHFAVTDVQRHSIYQLSERLTTVLSYINTHYAEDISLNDLAETLYFTPQYFAKFFKQNMGVTTGEYINSVRLNHALRALQGTEDSTAAIGEQCGFSNTRSFVDSFRKKMGVTPSVWRKQKQAGTEAPDLYTKDKETGYFNVDSNILFSSLSDFLKKYSTPAAVPQAVPSTESPAYMVYADTAAKGTRHHRRALCFIGVSHIRELLVEPIQAQLREAQRTIGFRYVKCHGIFDDCMMVYGESNGRPIYNFACVDMAYDFLLSIGLKPLVQLSFMPSLLAQNPTKTTFYNKMITSLPKDSERWQELVRRLVAHLLARYGEAEVSSWLFTVWNEPNTSEFLFGFRSEREYFDLFKSSYDAVKSVNPKVPVGGPSAFSTYGKNNDWIFRFLTWAQAHQCPPDFLDMHYYDVDMSDPAVLPNGRRQATILSPQPSSYADFLIGLKKHLKEQGYGDLPLMISEWNTTASHRDPLSDTCFKSCAIVKNQLETLDVADGSGYWLLTDLHSEMLMNDRLFHGGLGMFTYSGIRKPAFYAYQFLSQLKKRILSRGSGYIVTMDDDGSVAVLLYNYFHYSPAYANEVGINTSYTERYSVFPDMHSQKIELQLRMPGRQYRVTQQYVNRQHGSALDTLVSAGAIEPLSPEENTWLASASAIGFEKSIKPTEGGRLQFGLTLEPQEIRLILIDQVL